MVFVDQNTNSCDPRSTNEKQSLLSKYQIPIQNLDFAYVETCKDANEIEKILKILRSKEEGFYPDLIKATENRLRTLKPKSKLLREVCKVPRSSELPQEARDEVNKDLVKWLDDVSKNDQELGYYKNQKRRNTDIPNVREIQELTEHYIGKSAKKPLAATDYRYWDKYDPDTELLKMDLEEERLKSSMKNKTKKDTTKKTVKFNDLNEIESEREANYEREKGNECFKTSDLETALQHYTNSISFKPNGAAYSNRALIYLKLEKYNNALDDCFSALSLEPYNLKALIRKATAFEHLNQNDKALETIDRVIEIVPNNSIAQQMATRLRSKCKIMTKNTRLVIEEVDNHISKAVKYQKSHKNMRNAQRKDSKVIIPIPGTSNMPPPYYVECSENNAEKIRETAVHINSQPQPLHLVTVENEEDEECCLVNHFEKKCLLKQSETVSEPTEKHSKPSAFSEFRQKCTIKHMRTEIEEDKQAGGEPFIQNDGTEMPDDIHSPYSFLKTWNSANGDSTHEQHAQILRSLDMSRLVHVIGCKMDNAMFTSILKCLRVHFTVPGEVIRLHSILENIVNLPRFDIVAMLMSDDDKACIKTLMNFLNQHGKSLSCDTANKLF